ncbi:hypothetical protein [Streptomyces sp. NBC_00094]|uniref:hypothetical protein n=1 Tax=Streptomyces sp. NBC_00094 TaxID=2903620 RepID=UPI002257297C|nr:hypothetical protein [Streptomyces sp. NBC_00094]MCX5392553.1 hypothetical protein [Streptomyces sp. NBC_00094]
MDTEPGAGSRERVVDWLAAHPDLPHLFAYLSELVHVSGYAPEELVVIPRAEVDRRETTAFTSGWAEAVSDELPRIRREYEKRVADAYAQGQGDARGIRRPQRRTDAGQEGARVIALPFARLLEPPAAVVEAEERVRRERELFEQRAEPEQRPASEQRLTPGQRSEPVQRSESGQRSEPGPEPERKESEADPEPDVLVTAQENRARRNAQPVRKVVRGKGGRPIVPPLAGVPAQVGPPVDRRDADSAEPDARASRGRRLSDRARALEKDMTAERGREEAPPEPAP